MCQVAAVFEIFFEKEQDEQEARFAEMGNVGWKAGPSNTLL